jgi:hypothetical protein
VKLSGIFAVGYLVWRIVMSPVWNHTSRLGNIPLIMLVNATPWFIPFLKNETVLLRASYWIPMRVVFSSHLHPYPKTVPLYWPCESILTSFRDQTSQYKLLGESLQKVDAKYRLTKRLLTQILWPLFLSIYHSHKQMWLATKYCTYLNLKLNVGVEYVKWLWTEYDSVLNSIFSQTCVVSVKLQSVSAPFRVKRLWSQNSSLSLFNLHVFSRYHPIVQFVVEGILQVLICEYWDFLRP